VAGEKHETVMAPDNRWFLTRLGDTVFIEIDEYTIKIETEKVPELIDGLKAVIRE